MRLKIAVLALSAGALLLFAAMAAPFVAHEWLEFSNRKAELDDYNAQKKAVAKAAWDNVAQKLYDEIQDKEPMGNGRYYDPALSSLQFGVVPNPPPYGPEDW